MTLAGFDLEGQGDAMTLHIGMQSTGTYMMQPELALHHPYMCTLQQQIMHKHSLSKVLSVCSTLHIPAPSSDTALTLMLYSVPGSSPVRIVEVAAGKTETGLALLQEFQVVPFLLYCNWY